MSKNDTAEAIVRKLARFALPQEVWHREICLYCRCEIRGGIGHGSDCLYARARAWVRANAKKKEQP